MNLKGAVSRCMKSVKRCAFYGTGASQLFLYGLTIQNDIILSNLLFIINSLATKTVKIEEGKL